MKHVRTTVCVMLSALAAVAQTAPKSDQIQGAIASVNLESKQIAVTTDKGEAITITTTDRTVLVRMPAGVTDPKQGVKIDMPAIAAGDKLIAIGKLSADKKTLEGAKVYVLTKSDIAQIHKQEDEDWQKRGTSGEVVSIDPAAKTLTVKAGAKQITIETNAKTEFQRYSLDSFKSTDAKPSNLTEVLAGDQVRVLGNKNADGDKVTAERVFSGTFKHYSATIDSIDPATNEVKVKDLATKKSLIIRLDPESQIKKLAPEVAAMMARRFNPGMAAGGDGAGAGRGGPGGPGGQAGPGGGFGGRGPGGAGGPGGPGGPGGGRGAMSIGQVFDRAPAVTLANLKQGDAVVVLTTAGSTPGKVTAVMMVAGVEPLLTSPSATRDLMSGWGLGGGGGGGGEGN